MEKTSHSSRSIVMKIWPCYWRKVVSYGKLLKVEEVKAIIKKVI